MTRPTCLGSALATLLLAGASHAAVVRSAAPREERAPHAPLVGEPQVRWTFEMLALEGAPVARGEHVLVHGRDPSGRRALVVLDAASGRVLSRTLFATSTPLEVDIVDERVAVRAVPNRVDVFRMRGARLVNEGSFPYDSPVSAPRLTEDALVLASDDVLVLHDLEERAPRWSVRRDGVFRGAPELVGDDVLALWSSDDGTLRLARFEGATGKVVDEIALGQHRGDEPGNPDGAALTVHSDVLFAHLGAPVPSTDGSSYAWARVPLDGGRFGSSTLHRLLAAPLETERGWIAPERTREGTRWILVDEGGGPRVVELASPAHHAWLCASERAAAGADGVFYAGGCAADLDTLRVLWKRPDAPDFPPVPVDHGLLVVEKGLLVALADEVSPVSAEREKARQLALARERALGEELAGIANRALRGGDAELARRLVEEAEALGASGRTIAFVRAEAERRAGTDAGPRLEQRRAALQREEEEARRNLLDELSDAARHARGPETARALLRELFLRAPDHADGLAVLAANLPEGAAPGPADALAWLDFLALADRNSLERLPDGDAAPSVARLEREREEWRPDAVAYRSERLLVVTAGTAPDAVARAMRTGELVQDVLERIFGGSRQGAAPLEVVLYPTREEYLRHSNTDLGGLENVLGFTSGHFDLNGDVSRLFLPPDDAGATRMVATTVHELTHHWLATRSRFGRPRSGPAQPGFWVVEGIATWAEELDLDPRRGVWSTAPERAASLDTVVNATADDLLPWSEVLTATFDDYRRLETRPTCTLSLDWHLGALAPRSPMQLYYAQAAALAHYLHDAERGAGREVLVRAVEDYYRGETLDVPAALGLSPEALGARVVAWARSRVR